MGDHRRHGRPDPVSGPHRFEIDFHATHQAAAVALIPTVEQAGPCTVAFSAPSATRAAQTFKICCAIASGAAEAEYG